MSTKNQSLQKRKQAKVKARKVQIQQKKHKERVLMGQALKSNDVVADVAKNGTLSVAQRIYNAKQKVKLKPQELGNREVLESINEVVPVIGLIHGGIEVFATLVKEGKIAVGEDGEALINRFDEQVVKLTEDVNALITFIEVEKKPDDFIDLYLHFLDLIAEMMTDSMSRIRDELFAPNEELISEFTKEHIVEGETYVDVGLRYHEQRMRAVVPLYKTNMEGIDLPLDEEEDDQEQLVEVTGSLQDHVEIPMVSSAEEAKEKGFPIAYINRETNSEQPA